MATTNPSDKFAFLLSNSTDDGYVKDLETVFDTLHTYYNYPKDQIWVVFGDSGTSKTYFTDAQNALITDYSTAIDNFITAAQVPADPTMLIYFTGVGNSNGELEISSPTDKIDESWLDGKTGSLTNGQAHFVFQHDRCKNLENSFGSIGITDFTRTFACETGETRTPADPLLASNFTKVWTAALRFQTLDSGQFADQLSVSSGYTQEEFHISLEQAFEFAKQRKDDLWPSGGPDPDPSTYSFIEGDNAYYLGLPDFLIRDGDQQNTVPVGRWESPDIYLTHPHATPAIDGDHAANPYDTYADYYIQDAGGTVYDNVINVRVINYGTHPVRKLSAGVKRYDSGVGGSGEVRASFEDVQIQDPNPPNDMFNAVLCPIFFDTSTDILNVIPVDDFTNKRVFSYTFLFEDIQFPTQSHSCVRAVAQLTALDPTLGTADIDTRDWSLRYDLHDEAQRNIDWYDLGVDKSADGGGEEEEEEQAVGAGEGNLPVEEEQIPEDTGDEEKTEEMNRNIRNYKEHEYEIKNPYRDARSFLLVFPENYKKCLEHLQLEWFTFKNNFEKELIPLEIKDEPVQHIAFELQPGESVRIVLWLAKRATVKTFDDIFELRFEILVSPSEKDKQLKKLKRSFRKELQKEFALLSGITIKVRQKTAELYGKLLNYEGKPVRNAMIMLQTANSRQGAIIRTDKKGNYKFKNINPDVYKISAVSKAWHTETKYINVLPLKGGINYDFKDVKLIHGVRLKLILDKIRILDDKEFFLKRKGDFVFRALVLPDKNKKLIKEIQIPEKGVIKRSDKPGRNDIDLGITLFEGIAQESLLFVIQGTEKDVISPDDKLNRYQRYFTGNPQKWFGRYSPTNGYLVKEDVGDWQVWYRIVRM